jgi:hypothetical protein
MAATAVSKIGFHSVGPNRNGYDECLNVIAAAGRRPSLIKCRDNFGAIDAPLSKWPEIVTIGAMTAWDDADYNVAKAYDSIIKAARLNPRIKYWEFFNERNGEYERQADFYIELMPRLRTAGVGLCMFNSASGTPQYAELDPVPYREVSRACAFARAGNCNVILGLHEYMAPQGQSDADHIGRYKRLADYLHARNALIPIAITEWGWEVCGNRTSQYLAWAERADAVYMGDDSVIGTAMWTLGGGGWGDSNYAKILPQLGQYMATVKAPVPPQPPAPVIPPVPTLEARVASLEARVAALEAHD